MTTKKMTKTQAGSLWSGLREALVNYERLLKEIIENEAWLPLGFETFTEAWMDRMGPDFPIGSTYGVMIAAQILKEGLDPTVLNGIGPATVERAVEHMAEEKRSKALGVPMRKSRKINPSPSRAKFITIEVSAEVRERWVRIAEAKGSNITKEVEIAAAAWFDAIEGRLKLSA